jgi:hypothetical protein
VGDGPPRTPGPARRVIFLVTLFAER